VGQAGYRVQFFQLMDVFLASPKVPAYTAAAFVKKFARLSLRVSPAGMADPSPPRVYLSNPLPPPHPSQQALHRDLMVWACSTVVTVATVITKLSPFLD
jgi:hypothetical protein